MEVALVGYAIEGKAAYDYWANLGANITICDADQNKQIPDGAKSQLGEAYLSNLDRFDVVWRSAGVNPRVILDANPGINDKITTTMNEFLRVCPARHVIGVTGTKGKGTTTTLIARMLEAAGKTVYLGGNIGLSPFEFLPRLHEDSFVVLELSSFQLSDLKRSPSTAVCLMVVPEHLNWHADMDAYILAKAQLFEHQSAQDTAIYFAKSDESRKIASYSPGLKIPYFAEPGALVLGNAVTIAGQQICETDELKLLGKHNWQNVCAAVTTVWQFDQNIEAVRKVLTSFSGLPHRLELVRNAAGVQYYNDSFASTPDATIAALDAITRPKILIVGGFDRMLPITHLAKAIKAHQDDIRKVVVIGASAARLTAALDDIQFKNYQIEETKSMPEIVKIAAEQAKDGDAVVLSPGFASFDMFQNFEERGLQFRSAVNAL